MWSHYNCNPPSWMVDLMMKKAGELGPDLFLYTGIDYVIAVDSQPAKYHTD